MKKTILGVLTSVILASSVLSVKAEPRLEDIPLDNYSLYSTVTIDLHDAIKDPGNEYVIRWYANEELVNEVYGLFGNQIITYQYVIDSAVGKQVYATIEAYNTKEVAKTEKRILQPANGNVKIVRDSNKLKADISKFENTTEYNIEWYIDNELIGNGEYYQIKEEDIGKYVRCKVTSVNTKHTVMSETIMISENYDVKVSYNKSTVQKGEWINGISGRWYSYKDGSHPVGNKLEDGSIEYDWREIDNTWFAFDNFGYVPDGFIVDAKDKETYYMDNEKGLSVGWQLINNNWYYFNELHDGTFGKLLKNCETPDGYKVNEYGVWIE